MHTYIHIHTYIQACLHTYVAYIYIYIYMHSNMHRCVHTYMQTLHTYIHTYIHTKKHTYIHTDIRAYVRVRMNVPTYQATNLPTFVTYIKNKCMHAYIQTSHRYGHTLRGMTVPYLTFQCIPLHYLTLHCMVLHHCMVWHRIAPHCNALHTYMHTYIHTCIQTLHSYSYILRCTLPYLTLHCIHKFPTVMHTYTNLPVNRGRQAGIEVEGCLIQFYIKDLNENIRRR